MTSTAIDPQALDEAAQWLMCLSEGEASEAEQAAWAAWRTSSVERERAWQRAELLLGKLGGLPPALAMSALDRPADPRRRAAIARLALMLAAVPAAWAGWKVSDEQAWMADYRSALGECRELTLADGTRVFLNTDSAIDVRYDAQQRFIQLLRGEILVHTATDRQQPPRPLRVGTREGRMQALGTRFCVREQGGRTYLAVLEGAVRIEPANARPGAVQVVRAGEKTDFDAHSSRAPQAVDASISAWTHGMLLADRMRLEDFAAELGRYRRGFIRCDPQIADLRVSGAFPLNDSQRSLTMLAATYPLAVKAHLNGYWLLLTPA